MKIEVNEKEAKDLMKQALAGFSPFEDAEITITRMAWQERDEERQKVMKGLRGAARELPENLITAIKAFREATGYGLKDTKDLVDAVRDGIREKQAKGQVVPNCRQATHGGVMSRAWTNYEPLLQALTAVRQCVNAETVTVSGYGLDDLVSGIIGHIQRAQDEHDREAEVRAAADMADANRG